ncbi:hypothetical protein [Brucella intermedia]|uniref:hypothetical protein n=1 Tax=Brucella intermedia TaxID=94625 RepID=UPI00128D46C4|nr:hypothetical protein [Brucella intermedia]
MISELPVDFKRYKSVTLCSNYLRGIDSLIVFHDVTILLVGKGLEGPEVWLQSPTDNTRDTWSYVVEKNRIRHPKFSIQKDSRSVRVKAGGTLVVSAELRGDDEVIVNRLDLKPIGLLVSGDATGLTVGTTRLEGNNIISGNGGSFISVGPSGAKQSF